MIYKAHGHFFILLSTVAPHNTCPFDGALQSPEGFFPSIPLFLLLLKFNIYVLFYLLINTGPSNETLEIAKDLTFFKLTEFRLFCFYLQSNANNVFMSLKGKIALCGKSSSH